MLTILPASSAPAPWEHPEHMGIPCKQCTDFWVPKQSWVGRGAWNTAQKLGTPLTSESTAGVPPAGQSVLSGLPQTVLCSLGVRHGEQARPQTPSLPQETQGSDKHSDKDSDKDWPWGQSHQGLLLTWPLLPALWLF